MDYPEKRNLDPVYFRVERNGRYEDVCFTDLTEAERDKAMQNRPPDWYKGLATILADQLRFMGDDMNIKRNDE